MNSSRDRVRRNLTQTVIGRPLIDKMEASQNPDTLYDVIIDPNLDFRGGRERACERIRELIGSPSLRTDSAHPYIFATLTGRAIREVTANDAGQSEGHDAEPAPAPGKQRLNSGARAIHRIWEDTEVEALLTNSVSTVKADAAQAAFAAEGKDIVWAVVDSGIDRRHQHFSQYCNLTLALPLEHKDFTPDGTSPLTDEFGHGTHVAGIIAGRMDESRAPQAILQIIDDDGGAVEKVTQPLARSIRGIAPQCRLLSLKVLNAEGKGKASAVIEAIAAIQKLNDFGRRIVVHGVNLSLGYAFMPEWFACGQSPLCTEVNRLVKSGVVVVAAAGNSGYGSIDAMSGSVTAAGLPLTINDPGNAENAITVGSTHRDMPHTYGVSYFSSKGPTGDGRLKPDLVAPGERILSCAAGKFTDYVEDSGTSMAAPHVSGAIAAFLSIRREYIGQPEEVKKIFMETATDLKRDRTFQGTGLLDLMRAIQSI
jgi:subtilisin family serine protease